MAGWLSLLLLPLLVGLSWNHSILMASGKEMCITSIASDAHLRKQLPLCSKAELKQQCLDYK